MKSFFDYFYCYALGAIHGWRQASVITPSLAAKFGNAIKGANLTICFQGFVPIGYDRPLRRCAEIGALAATFDLLSDISHFEPGALKRFDAFVVSLLHPEAVHQLRLLTNAKSTKTLKLEGLQRGVFAVEIIFAHLEVRPYWNKKIDIPAFGIFSQIADDIMDWEEDRKTTHLNFLKTEQAEKYLRDYVDWDINQDLRWSSYPLILGYVLQSSQRRARRILKSWKTSQINQTASIATKNTSDDTTEVIVPPAA